MSIGITPGERTEREAKTARIHNLLDKAEELQDLVRTEFGEGLPTVNARSLCSSLRKILADRELEDARDRRRKTRHDTD